MSFAQHFQKVNAVELDKQRYGLLQHNIKALGYENKVTTYNGDFLGLMPNIKQDVVFLDPPWVSQPVVVDDVCMNLASSDVCREELVSRWRAGKGKRETSSQQPCIHSFQNTHTHIQGGKMYTENDKVDLTFGGVPLSELCERLKEHAQFIVLKLPLNFNFEGKYAT